MGQYYEVLMVEEGNLIHLNRTVQGRESQFVGAKLMEHSWCGNSFCDAVTNLLIDSPANIIWMGDYADEDEGLTDGSIDSFINNINKALMQRLKDETKKMDSYLALYKFRCSDDGTSCPPSPHKVKYSELYLVNNTKKEYLVMKDYMEKSTDGDGWCAYPLSILTSLGNGSGGGDYYGRNEDMAGYWAGNEVYFSKTKPEDYAQCDIEKYSFVED